MKLQGLAIIFVIIILPITIIIGEYANTQTEIFKNEQLSDSRLITATYDSLKAFQINTFNDATSDMADSKISSIEAAVNAFYNSIETSFGLQGYSKEDLKLYVPALVYTMYDGYYIYSPYTNVAQIVEKTSGSEGTELDDEFTEKELTVDLDSSDIEYGLKPYVYYSCRYKKGGYYNIDVVINYALDNYITVQGSIDGQAYYKSGYLVTIASTKTAEGLYKETTGSGNDRYYYNGIEISMESNLEDTLVEKDGSTKQYKYIKLNGTKYYWNEPEEYIFYINGGNRVTQVSKDSDELTYGEYVEKIEHNTSAISYYASAYEFTEWVNQYLGELTPADAVVDGTQQLKITPSAGSKIFENEKIEYSGSNFNLHRKEVIRYLVESNLSVATANFNNYTSSGNDFQMPKLSENDWEIIENEISIISFLQGLNIGGKIYNGYSVVANAKTEEVVKEERICIATNDGYYHKVNDKHFTEDFDENTIVMGVFDLDYEIRKDGATGASYMPKSGLGCYTSIVGQENVNTNYDSIYEYLQNEDVSNKIKQIYYTALGRERWGAYKVENPVSIPKILTAMNPESPSAGGEEVPETTISVSINDADFKNTYTVRKSESVTLTKQIYYTLPTIDAAKYTAKFTFFKRTSIDESIWNDTSTTWYGCEQSGFTRGFTLYENSGAVGTWWLLAKIEDNEGKILAYDSKVYTIELEDVTPPEIIIENQDGVTDGKYIIKSGYSNTTISEKIIVNNEAGGKNLKSDSFLYIFTQQSSEPNETAGWKNYGGTGAIVTEPISEEGTWYLYVKAEDEAGNKRVERRTYVITKEPTKATYDIKITDAGGNSDTTVYTIPRFSSVTLSKQISVSASDGSSTENLTIKYAIVERGKGSTNWYTYTPGSTIMNNTVSYNDVYPFTSAGMSYNLSLQIQVLDAEGNEVAYKDQWYIFRASSR